LQIKVCGLTRREDIDFCCRLGVNALGFILAESPRRVSLRLVEKLITGLPPFTATVAVVVNPSPAEIKDIIASRLFSYIQFHGEEEPGLIKDLPIKTIKAISILNEEDLKRVDDYQGVDYFLFDSRSGIKKGGTGIQFDWDLLKNQVIEKPFILAGGLGPDNIVTALQEIKMAGVDLNSCVEKEPGIKDHRLLRDTVMKIRRMELEGELYDN